MLPGGRYPLPEPDLHRLELASLAWRTSSRLSRYTTAFHVTADWLIFEEGERDLPNSLQLKFEAVMQMSDEDQRTIQSLIDGMILKHTANQLTAAN